MFDLKNALEISHDYMEQLILPGDSVIDATVGNGKDTVFLAGLVGEQGRVYGFDVQQIALDRAAEKLKAAGLLQRVQLFCEGHQNMEQLVPERVKFVDFNLGYLPAGDKTVTTLPETTLAAVEAALRLLLPGGMCTLCVYPGHAEGERELYSLLQWLRTLNEKEFTVLYRAFWNQSKRPPELFAIRKNPKAG